MSLLNSRVKEGRPSQYDSARGLDAVKPSNKRPVKSEKKKFAANLKRVTAIANYNIEYKKRINLGLNGGYSKCGVKLPRQSLVACLSTILERC